jgi:5'(3')-deoxyribonucleotidase
VSDFLRIVFDVDNVLADTMTIFCKKASGLLGFEVGKRHIKNHKVVGSIPLQPQMIFSLQSEVWADWKNLPPLEENLSRKMQAFQEIGFEVYIATSIPLRLMPNVKQWLEKLQIRHDKFFHCTRRYCKSDIQAEALVDDAPEEVQGFLRSGRKGFLYLQPWNSTRKIQGAVLVRNIDDVLGHYGIGKDKDGAYRDIRWLAHA